jgi:hypothetical protein
MDYRIEGKPTTDSTNIEFDVNGVYPAPDSAIPKEAAPDPFDPASLRLTADACAAFGVKKALLSIPVRKPDKSWWVQTHPDPAYRLLTAVLELKEDRETYQVARALWPSLSTEPTFSPRALITTITRTGVLFLWPIRLPGADGKIDDWNRTALESADKARGRWCRVAANMQLGAYELMTAHGEIPDPEWPEISFEDILSIAFKNKRIDSPNHPVLRRLKGEV